MSAPISEDTKVRFFIGYFSIILATGLGEFLRDVLFVSSSSSLNILPLSTLSFIFVYVWIVSYWIIYNKLTVISPYKNNFLFFLDVSSFTLLLIILFISYHIEKDLTLLKFFILSFAILHILGGIVASKSNYKRQKNSTNKLFIYSVFHFIWSSIFFILLGILYLNISNISNISNIKEYLFYVVLILIFTFNIVRFVILRKSDIDTLLVFDRRPITIGKSDYNEFAKHYQWKSLRNIIIKRNKNRNEKVDHFYWYHIRIRNIHNSKAAVNCIIHLERWNRIIGYEKNDFKVEEVTKDSLYDVDFKWMGVTDKEVLIEPDEFRDFDGLCVYQHQIKKLNEVTKKPKYYDDKITPCIGINQNIVDNDNVRNAYLVEPGDYQLHFIVYSLNMKSEKGVFILHIPNDENIDKIILHKKNNDSKHDHILNYRQSEKKPICEYCFNLKQKNANK